MSTTSFEYFYMIPVNNNKTKEKLSENDIAHINEILHENLKYPVYKSDLDQIMIHCEKLTIKGGDFMKDNVLILFIRTLSPISNPLFMTCQEANQKLNLSRYYDFDSVYYSSPGVRFNKNYNGNFVEYALSVRLL